MVTHSVTTFFTILPYIYYSIKYKIFKGYFENFNYKKDVEFPQSSSGKNPFSKLPSTSSLILLP